MKKRKINRGLGVITGLVMSLTLVGCVDQSQGKIRDNENTSIAVTSSAIMSICEKMGIDLTGVPESTLVEVPDIYKDATIIGSPMAPDLEILSDLNPDWVLSPLTLMSDLQPKYDAAGLSYAFVNLKSVRGMYESITGLGELFGKEAEAAQLVQEYEEFVKQISGDIPESERPTILLLMGLPNGAYIVATENSYAGDVVDLAGGINVYAGTTEEFLNINPEDMLEKNPDIILRTAHAMPEDVMDMFDEEFKTNDIWSHFDAVKSGNVYDLPHEYFGMSATLDYQNGLEYVKEVLYGE